MLVNSVGRIVGMVRTFLGRSHPCDGYVGNNHQVQGQDDDVQAQPRPHVQLVQRTRLRKWGGGSALWSLKIGSNMRNSKRKQGAGGGHMNDAFMMWVLPLTRVFPLWLWGCTADIQEGWKLDEDGEDGGMSTRASGFFIFSCSFAVQRVDT